jgi:hypothetical protein
MLTSYGVPGAMVFPAILAPVELSRSAHAWLTRSTTLLVLPRSVEKVSMQHRRPLERPPTQRLRPPPRPHHNHPPPAQRAMAS